MKIINKTSQDIEIWIGDDRDFFPGCLTLNLPTWKVCYRKLQPVLLAEQTGVVLIVSPAMQSALRG